jgi:AcrR family transcriptional regulator
VQRQRLIDAALRAIQKRPYEKITIAEIVREAGMSSRSFYDHFVSKEDVVAEIVRDRGRKLIGSLEEIYRSTKNDVERVDRALRAYLELFPAETVDLERIGGEAGQRVREMRDRYIEAITDIVVAQYARAHEVGAVARVPARFEVELLLTGLAGLSFRYYSEGRRAELVQLQPALLALLMRAFH